MREEVIQDFYKRTIGYMVTQDNGEIWAYDFYRRLLGKYLPKENITKDFYGRVIAHGNMLSSLIKPIEEQVK